MGPTGILMGAQWDSIGRPLGVNSDSNGVSLDSKWASDASPHVMQAGCIWIPVGSQMGFQVDLNSITYGFQRGFQEVYNLSPNRNPI